MVGSKTLSDDDDPPKVGSGHIGDDPEDVPDNENKDNVNVEVEHYYNDCSNEGRPELDDTNYKGFVVGQEYKDH